MSRKPTNVSVFGIQRKIVANMTVEGWQDAPHCSYTFEPDLTEFYKKYQVFADELKKDGKRITFNTVMMKAICEALKAAPEMNAHIKFNRKLVRGEVTTFDQIDVSMPCILPDGRMMTITMEDMGNRSLGNMTEYTAEMMKKMEKTNKLDSKTSIRVSNNIEWALIYKDQFGRDVLPMLIPVANTFIELAVSVMKSTGGKALDMKNAGETIKDLDISDIQSALYSLAGLEFTDILNIAWAMAKAADDTIEEPRVWVRSLTSFPVDAVVPVIFDMNLQFLTTTKNYKRLQAAVEALKPKNSTSTES